MDTISLLNYTSLLNIFSLTQGIIFGCVLIYLSSKRRPSFFLGLFLLIYGVSDIVNILAFRGVIEKHPFLFFLPVRFYFLKFPLLFLYVQELTLKPKIRYQIKHLYPGVFEFIFLSSLLILFLFGELNISNVKGGFLEGSYYLAANLFAAFYLFKILTLLKENENRVNDFYSEVKSKLLYWIKTLVYGFLILTAIFIAFILIQLLVALKVSIPEKPILIVYILASIANLVLMYWAVIFGVKQHYISLDNKTINKIVKASISVTKSEKHDNFDYIFNQVITLIEQSKCFKNKELTIIDLAYLIDINHQKLSQVINYKTNSNFNTFINKYRIEEAKEILLDPNRARKYTMEGLGHEVGFKSRSSLYIAFKKFENCTPGKFTSINN